MTIPCPSVPPPAGAGAGLSAAGAGVPVPAGTEPVPGAGAPPFVPPSVMSFVPITSSTPGTAPPADQSVRCPASLPVPASMRIRTVVDRIDRNRKGYGMRPEYERLRP
ncbi:hypothetical protein UK14_17840 [Streptomyces sp. NRRL F-4428]|nr:hypothetical protein UK14_17840 [Streptomyces sp. NRRL F-4428]